MCDSIAALGAHTASGATLFAKNSDRREGECQPFLQLPAALHPRGAELRCTHVTIPQVAETYRVMGHAPWWVWGFEQGVNEHGVAIGNHTVFSREPVEERPGLIGMDLVRLGLERGRDSREALEIMAGLIEAHGQGGSAMAPGASGYHNSFLIADPEAAWLMETSGRRWAARPVELGSVSNHISLGTDWLIGSRDLESFARGEGWWIVRGRVDVAAAYRNPHVPGQLSEGRQRRSTTLLEASKGRLDVAAAMGLLRDHGAGNVAPPADAPPEDERCFTLCMHSEPVGTTTASLIAELPEDGPAPSPVWVSFGTPCTGIFVPVYIDGVIPAVLALGGEEFESDSAWWVFHRLQQSAVRDLARNIPILRRGWAPLEEKIEIERRSAERAAHDAFVEGDADAAADQLSTLMNRVVGEVLDTAEVLRANLES
ncbi:MAG: C69 family dipeptidase [Deltaproteobacteria bacterium]|nr:C69 family dipeptidase [Deltaproteobacteria bacterium]MBW2419863.1 C69 family dipeptidase [Deltaproteobacteria bacterium]